MPAGLHGRRPRPHGSRMPRSSRPSRRPDRNPPANASPHPSVLTSSVGAASDAERRRTPPCDHGTLGSTRDGDRLGEVEQLLRRLRRIVDAGEPARLVLIREQDRRALEGRGRLLATTRDASISADDGSTDHGIDSLGRLLDHARERRSSCRLQIRVRGQVHPVDVVEPGRLDVVDDEHGGRIERRHHRPVAVGFDDRGDRTAGDAGSASHPHLDPVTRRVRRPGIRRAGRHRPHPRSAPTTRPRRPRPPRSPPSHHPTSRRSQACPIRPRCHPGR